MRALPSVTVHVSAFYVMAMVMAFFVMASWPGEPLHAQTALAAAAMVGAECPVSHKFTIEREYLRE